ncbi:FkbM family methyltransferase [Streptomyces wuyuanensis]|uniref:Methyltransferase, FkbM family n=1 Tax=Streptomyces wuyuanensis TaxID=1196353 RepID=A0A1G9N9F7_9ACTN|nr:FkbM family methyltransferase [Streptomyces wuyuanensis]SDL82767.1 methyltransferase, FkbM family [Streptomyces wuyuanensis]
MTLLHRARKAVQRFGFDVNRFPECSYDYRTVRLLRHSGADVVLDVGANRGQYGHNLRRFGYRGRIVSFEPLRGPFEALRRRAAADPLWTVFPYAVGDERTSVTLNVAGNSGLSSSVLPMLPRHAEACPDSRYVGRQEAEQYRLDDLWPQLAEPEDRVFVKLDVQGYEEAVLRGAEDLARRCCGLQLEASCVPLYEGGPLLHQVMDTAQRRYGLTLMAVVPGFTDRRTGQMLQCDVVFLRDREQSRRPEAAPGR